MQSEEMNARRKRGGELIKLRARTGLAQDAASLRCGVRVATWRSWEQNRRGITELQFNAIREKLK